MSLLLAAVWLLALAVNAAATPGMHCERAHMPCCPAPGHDGAHCSAVRCEPQAFQKSEWRSSREMPTAYGAGIERFVPEDSPRASLREPGPGLQFSISVFRLKDDLRI